MLGEKGDYLSPLFLQEHATMQEVTESTVRLPRSQESLHEILRRGA